LIEALSDYDKLELSSIEKAVLPLHIGIVAPILLAQWYLQTGKDEGLNVPLIEVRPKYKEALIKYGRRN
jgi:hypothetical protein